MASSKKYIRAGRISMHKNDLQKDVKKQIEPIFTRRPCNVEAQVVWLVLVKFICMQCVTKRKYFHFIYIRKTSKLLFKLSS